MSYTVGIKRRFWFGHKKYVVTGHDWQNFRFILNLGDGSQIHLPGFSCAGLRVYPDFWTHHAQGEREIERRRGRQGAHARPEPVQPLEDYAELKPVRADEPSHFQAPRDPRQDEVKRRAAERVRSIRASDEQPQGLPS